MKFITFSSYLLLLFLMFPLVSCNNTITKEKQSKPISTIETSNENHPIVNGIRKTYHDSGQLKSEGEYFLGQKTGLHKEWDKNGVLELEGFYSAGKANGLMKWYHGPEHLAAQGNMIDDVRNGKWMICDIDKDGYCIDAFFVNGKREGVWKIYDPKNKEKIMIEEVYKNDKRISQKCWDLMGKEIECS